MSSVIKSVYSDQDDIINAIQELYIPDGIELDPTFSKGVFYKNIKEPEYKFDLYPQRDDVKQADARNLPFESNSVGSIMFDPPFITGGRDGVDPTGIIRARFGYYKNMNELFDMYHGALKEFHRILKPKGVLVFKCQDTVSCSKQFLSHVEIINYAVSIGLYAKDMFVLTAKNRIIDPKIKKQQHCRKFHSYFLVFTKETPKVVYSNCTSTGGRQDD